MRREVTCAIVLALAFLTPSRARHAAAGDLPANVVESYRPAVERLRQVYTHATVFGSRHYQVPAAGKSLEQHFIYRAAAGKLRLDTTTLAAREMQIPPASSDLFMATPHYSLLAFRSAGSTDFDTARSVNYAAAKTQLENTCPLHFAYSLDGTGTILEHLERPEIHVVGFETVTHDGNSLLKINFIESAEHNLRQADWKSFVLLAPAEGWALREYVRSAGQGHDETRFCVSLSYHGSHEGAPLVQQIDCQNQQGAHHACQSRNTITVSHFLTGAVAEFYFTAPSL